VKAEEQIEKGQKGKQKKKDVHCENAADSDALQHVATKTEPVDVESPDVSSSDDEKKEKATFMEIMCFLLLECFAVCRTCNTCKVCNAGGNCCFWEVTGCVVLPTCGQLSCLSLYGKGVPMLFND
jgi:hypothetical protein